MYVWSFANQKGGTGKTTTAIHAASALALRGKRVLLVDLDPQAHATLGVGYAPENRPTLAHVLLGEERLSDTIAVVAGGIHLVPSSLELAELEVVAERMLGPERLLDQALSEVRARYDWVLVDCPPRAEGVLCANAVRASDTVVLVVETGVFALRGALRAIDIFEEHARRIEREIDLRLVATMFDRRTRLARDVLTAMHARFGEALFDTAIRSSVHLREALAHGVPLNLVEPKSGAATDFEALCEEFLRAVRRPRTLAAHPGHGPACGAADALTDQEAMPWNR